MLISDDLYSERKGATDSEAIFLLALGLGMREQPIAAMEQAIVQMQDLSQRYGQAPHIRLSAAYSDGERLFVVRYASDMRAPTLYYRYCNALGGFMVVSEPLDPGQNDWTSVPQGTICCFSKSGVRQHDFLSNCRRVAC